MSVPRADLTSAMPADGVFTTQGRFPGTQSNEPQKVFARLMWFTTSGEFITYADEGPKSVEVLPPPAVVDLPAPTSAMLAQAASMPNPRYVPLRDANGNPQFGMSGSSNNGENGPHPITLALGEYAEALTGAQRNKLISMLKSIVAGGNEPACEGGGFQAQIEMQAASMAAVCRMLPIWGALTEMEQTRWDVVMKGLLFSQAFVLSAKHPQWGQGFPWRNLRGVDNIWPQHNPNHRAGYIGCIIAAALYFGVSTARRLLDNFDLDAFVAEANAAGMMHIRDTFTRQWPNTATKAQVEAAIHGWTYRHGNLDITQIPEIVAGEAYYCFDRPVVRGLNGGAGIVVNAAVWGTTIADTNPPLLGTMGMARELDTVDAGGLRSELRYSIWGIRSITQMMLMAVAYGRWDPRSDMAQAAAARMDVGMTDLMWKQRVVGYRDYANGQPRLVWNANSPEDDARWGLQYTWGHWEHQLRPLHNGQTKTEVPPAPQAPDSPPDGQMRSSVTSGGVTFTFSAPTLSGQYADGRWWARSPVSITSISPASVRSGDRWMHGTMLNWGWNLGVAGRNEPSGAGNRQGADSMPHTRSDGTVIGANTISYDHTLNRDPAVAGPISFSSGQGGSVVKWRSNPDAQGTWRNKVSEIQVLTVVAQAPAAGALYPGYTSTRAKVTGLTEADVNLALLPNHAFPTAQGIPSTYEQVLSNARKVYQHGNLDGTKQNINPSPPNGRNYAQETAEGLIWLCSNWINASQKKALALAIISNGFDIYERAKSGGRWLDDGQLNCGRLGPITFAAVMLNHADMLATVDFTNSAIHRPGYKGRFAQNPPWPVEGPLFHELTQIRYVSQWRIDNAPNTPVNSRHPDPTPYPQSMLNRPEWGVEAWNVPAKDDYWLGGAYRSSNSGHQWHLALPMHLIPGMRQAVNHQAFFDYCDFLKDRMFQRPDSEGPNRPQPWFRPIWNAFRARGGPIYPHVCPTNRPGY